MPTTVVYKFQCKQGYCIRIVTEAKLGQQLTLSLQYSQAKLSSNFISKIFPQVWRKLGQLGLEAGLGKLWDSPAARMYYDELDVPLPHLSLVDGVWLLKKLIFGGAM